MSHGQLMPVANLYRVAVYLEAKLELRHLSAKLLCP